MSYSDGEAAVLAVIRLHAKYSEQNTSRGKFAMLNSGKSDRYVILRMGESPNQQLTTTRAMRTWVTEIMVYRRYLDDGTSAIALQENVVELMEHVERYATLQGTVTDAQVTGISAMEQVMMTANGPMWLRSTISLQWQEEKEISYL